MSSCIFYSFLTRLTKSILHLCHHFREGFAGVVPNVLKLAEGKAPLVKQYTDARQDALSEDRPGSDSHLANEPDNRSLAVITTLCT